MQRLAGHQSKPVRSLEVPLLNIEPVACCPSLRLCAPSLRLHRTVSAVKRVDTVDAAGLDGARHPLAQGGAIS